MRQMAEKIAVEAEVLSEKETKDTLRQEQTLDNKMLAETGLDTEVVDSVWL